jgi:hypothetical protein
MRLAIFLLIAVFGLFFGLIVYRCLLHSKRFARLVGGVIEPPAETPNEVLDQYIQAGDHAKEYANDCDARAQAAQKDALVIRDRLS